MSTKLFVIGVLSMAFILMQMPSAAWSADPSSARYSNDSSQIFWIVHISDSHIGSEWYAEHKKFEWFLDEGFEVIDPVVVVNTGDICDGSVSGIPASGQTTAEWKLYRNTVDSAAMTTDIYIDLPGNHDGYGDSGFTHYLEWSLNGDTFDKMTRSLELTFPFGSYLIYGASTPGNGGGIFIENPGFSDDEIAELEAELEAHDASDLVFAFGHHRLDQPDNYELFAELLMQHEAFYLHGHSHKYETYMHEDVVVRQISSLGKANTLNIAVIAVDNNAVNYAVTGTQDPWPFIVITAPAQRQLTDGSPYPYAYDVCNTGAANPVRALVFDSEEVTDVSFSIEDGVDIPMTQDPLEPKLWHGAWDASGTPEGEVSLAVTATGTKTGTRTRMVMLSDVDCPEPWSAPDAGTDAGEPDTDPADSGATDTDPPDTDEPDTDEPDTGIADTATDTTDSENEDSEDETDAAPDGAPDSTQNSGCNCRITGDSIGPAQRLFAIIASILKVA